VRSDEPALPALIDELAALLGISPHYYDIWGTLHVTGLATKESILRAMGIEDTARELKERRLRPWNRLVEPVMVATLGSCPSTLPLHFPLSAGEESGTKITLVLTDEKGASRETRLRGITPAAEKSLDGVRHVRVEAPFEPPSKIGYYSLGVRVTAPSGELSGEMRLIVAPERCFVPEIRTWGINVNLYSIRSRGYWGVGDLGDLRELIRWARDELKAGFLSINPLHATANRPPYEISPYAPISRLYRNTIYADMKSVFSALPGARKVMESGDLARELASLRDGELIDYERASALKLKALRVAFEEFRNEHLEARSPEARDFAAYVEAEGKALERFASYMALEERFGESGGGWQSWPPEYRDPEGEAVGEFKRAHPGEILFHQFVQWLLERQLRDAMEQARAMALGIASDLAVGSMAGGSDAWSYPGLFAFGVSAGAPPDSFSPGGQRWNFPPLIPEKLRENGYEIFIQTIRKNLAGAGAVRVDHALGLFRLFWIPEGRPPGEGTYVRYPYEDLLRIIALESARSGTAVIAEDLGTIGDEVREALRRFGMLSYRLFYFERDWSKGIFLPPGSYPDLAISAVNTHDLPTLAGFWEGRDIQLKKILGLYPDVEAADREERARERERQLMLDALGDFLPAGFPRDASLVPGMDPGLSLSIHRFLARTPSRLVAASLDDVLFAEDQQNLPGIWDAHNWRRKSVADLDGVIGNGFARELADMFRQEGRA